MPNLIGTIFVMDASNCGASELPILAECVIEIGWPDIHWLARDVVWADGSHCVTLGRHWAMHGTGPEPGMKLLGLLLSRSTGQRMAS